MKIWTLMENTACDPRFRSEHGLSLYIETETHRILFDAGQTGAFADNAQILGIDLAAVDLAVLSHGHYDHGGGFRYFLERNHRAPVYVSRFAFGGHYNAAGKYIGLDPALKETGRLIPVTGNLTLGEGITLRSWEDRNCRVPPESQGLQRMEAGSLVPEDFRHEQYLLVEEKGKRVLLSGCSHRGIANILRWIPCDTLIGGFHLMKQEPEGEMVRNTARLLEQGHTRYYTGHCTGVAQYAAMKKILGDRLEYLSAGSFLEI